MSSHPNFPPPLTVAAGLALSLALGWAGTAQAQTGAPDGDWPYYGGDMGATRFSPLDRIDASNVADLEIAWRWSAANFGPEPEGRSQTTPLEMDGVLYTTAGSRGQFCTIVPSRKLIVVRMGIDPNLGAKWDQETFVAEVLNCLVTD